MADITMSSNKLRKWLSHFKIMLTAIFLLFIILVGYFIYKVKVSKPINQDSTEYISITTTGGNAEDDKFTICLYAYFPETKELVKMIDFPYTAQYSLGAIDLYSNCIYLTQDVDDEGDQIFCCDLKTNEITQITDNLFAVNYIIPTKENVYFAACLNSSRNVCLGSYDKSNGEIMYWGNDGDTNIEFMCIDLNAGKIYAIVYSEAEDRYNLIHQTNDDFVIADHSVWAINLDLSSSEKLMTKSNEWIRMILPSHEQLVIIYDQKYNDSKTSSQAVQYDLLNQQSIPYKLPPLRIQNRGAGFSSDGESIYVLSQSEEDMTRKLYAYNVVEGSYDLLFEPPDNAVINSIQVVTPN